MIIRKAIRKDIDFIENIYEKIHQAEENGFISVGWKRDIYPVRKTAEDALKRHDLFVMEENGVILASGIINQEQVDVYKKAKWKFEATDSEVMVLHTLVVDPDMSGKGYGKNFVKFYEEYARSKNCKYLRIDTNEKNKSARSLYKSLDYKEIDCIPCTFNGLKGVNLILIEKKL